MRDDLNHDGDLLLFVLVLAHFDENADLSADPGVRWGRPRANPTACRCCVTRKELVQLRREAARWLAQLEAIPTVKARRAEIEPLPDAVSDQEWDTIIELVGSKQDRQLVAAPRTPAS